MSAVAVAGLLSSFVSRKVSGSGLSVCEKSLRLESLEAGGAGGLGDEGQGSRRGRSVVAPPAADAAAFTNTSVDLGRRNYTAPAVDERCLVPPGLS